MTILVSYISVPLYLLSLDFWGGNPSTAMNNPLFFLVECRLLATGTPVVSMQHYVVLWPNILGQVGQANPL